MQKIRVIKDTYKRVAINKVYYTLFIAFVYILGSNIILPGIDSSQLNKLINGTPSLSFVLSTTGFSITKLSLFSLGLAPWMSAMILWRVLSVTRIFNLQNFTKNQHYYAKFIISLLLGGVQSLSVMSQVRVIGTQKEYYQIAILVLLLTGLSILIWLGNVNSEKGIGGATIIILVSMIKPWPQRFLNSLPIGVSLWTIIPKLTIGLLFLLVFSYYSFRFYQGELRLKKMHIMLNGTRPEQSYLPIPVNPGGGMPFMYAFSVTLFPQYLFYFLKTKFPYNKFFETFYEQVQLNQVFGVLILFLCVVFLSYGFSYVNVDYKEIAENMKKSGDYFLGVYPGKNTEKYLFHKISYMASVSAICNGLIIGIPMILSLEWKSIGTWAYIVPTWFILMLLVYEIKLQFFSLYHRNDYKNLLECEKEKI